MSQTPTHATGFSYFASEYRWSAALRGALSAARAGGSELGEVDLVGRRLSNRVGDDDAWFDEWRSMGDRVLDLARREEEAEHRITAAGAYLRATTYYQAGERFRTPKDATVLDVYRKSVDCFQRFITLTDRPSVEAVEIPYQQSSLPAYFVSAENTDLSRPPCVVFFDGLDVTKEILYVRAADLVRRGVACLLVDGPGTGEAIRFRNLPCDSTTSWPDRRPWTTLRAAQTLIPIESVFWR